jgi:hypothetical protein
MSAYGTFKHRHPMSASGGGKSDILAPERHSGSVGRELPFHVQAVAPCYVFLANDEASYISGQVLHPNGGNVIGS